MKSRYADTAFDGSGARRFGGCWNSPGVAVVYAASTRSLAALEMAVHLDRSMLLSSYVFIRCEFDEGLVTTVAPEKLRSDWHRDPPPTALAEIGDAWARTGTTAVLEVPSAIIEQEKIYLLNPEHLDFIAVKVGIPEPFEFDPRLIK